MMEYWVLLGVHLYEFCEPLIIYHDEIVADRDLAYIDSLSKPNLRKFGKINFDSEFDQYELRFVTDRVIVRLDDKLK